MSYPKGTTHVLPNGVMVKANGLEVQEFAEQYGWQQPKLVPLHERFDWEYVGPGSMSEQIEAGRSEKPEAMALVEIMAVICDLSNQGKVVSVRYDNVSEAVSVDVRDDPDHLPQLSTIGKPGEVLAKLELLVGE